MPVERDHIEKSRNQFVNIIEKYRSKRGGRYIAGKTSAAAAAAYTTIYTHRLTLNLSI